MVVIEIIKKNYTHGKQRNVCTLDIKLKNTIKVLIIIIVKNVRI